MNPPAKFPIARTIPKTLFGALLIYLSYLLLKNNGLTAALALSGIALLIWKMSDARRQPFRWIGKLLIDCTLCGLGLILVIVGIRLWQHFDHALLLIVPLFTACFWIALAKDEGFGPWPREPLALAERDGGETHYSYEPRSSGGNSAGEDEEDDWLLNRYRIGHAGEGLYGTGSTSEVNPATGLMMLGALDSAGNSYGFSDSDDSSSGDLFSNSDDLFSDNYSSHDDSLHSNAFDD